MNIRSSTFCSGFVLTGLLLGASAPAFAARGIVLNAYSAEGLGMGGADVAVARDASAMNTNPAGLTQISAQRWDLVAYPYVGLFNHTDAAGNDTGVDRPAGAVMSGAYARRLEHHPDLVIGAGLFVQGGTGQGYSDLRTIFGTRDELSSNLGVFKLLGTVAWQASDSLSLGAGAGLLYVQGRQKFFPNTSDASDAQQPFFGLRFDGGESVVPSVQAGLLFRPRPDLTFGLSYAAKTKLPLKNGTATVNYESIAFGRVQYRDARIDGFAFPTLLESGIAYQLNPDWLLSAEIAWLDYSAALRDSRLRARQPKQLPPPGAATLDASSPIRWRDQIVYSAGFSYRMNARDSLRGGLMFMNNPIPDASATPVLNLGQTGGITAGYGHALTDGWSIDMVLEYQLPTTQRYSNPANQLGSRGKEHYEDISAMFALSRRW